MNIFECPTQGCKVTVEAIALEVWHECKHSRSRRVQLVPKLQPEVALSDRVAPVKAGVAQSRQAR